MAKDDAKPGTPMVPQPQQPAGTGGGARPPTAPRSA